MVERRTVSPHFRLDEVQSQVGRLGGADRYATAVGVSSATYPAGAATVYVATGTAFPDALAAGPAAGGDRAPLLLVPGSCLPDAVRAEIQRLGAARLVILGGPAAVSPAVEALAPCPAPTTTTTAPAVTTTTAPGPTCHPAYPDFCIPPPPPDLDCGDLSTARYPGARPNLRVVGTDPHGFDADRDGLGCESGIA